VVKQQEKAGKFADLADFFVFLQKNEDFDRDTLAISTSNM